MDSRTRRLVTLGVLALLVFAVIVGALAGNSRAQAAPTETAAAELLAQKYVPYVVVRVQEEECGPGEPYRPVPVESVMGDPNVVLRDPAGEVVKRGVEPQDLAGLGEGYYLDFPGDPLEAGCDYEEWFQAKQTEPTVHARVMSDPDEPGTLVLQYWFWWVFNDWNDQHEGDWEMIQLLFDADSATQALTTSPTSVAFAQHEGVEVAEWDDRKVLKDGDHVAVYPSEGSHAAYFTQSNWFGKSASAGFGCDNTGVADGVSAEVLVPQVEMLTDDLPWLTFGGRWGQQAPSFNNGPTGPNLKPQWERPVAWQEDKGRSDAVALPVALTSAEEMFCSLTAAGSELFIAFLADPILIVVLLLVLVAIIVGLARATRWRDSDPRLDRPRAAGQILTGSVRVLRRHGGEFGGVILGLMALLLVSYWVQAVVHRPAPTTDLALVGAPDVGVVGWVVLAVAGIAAALLTAYSVALSAGITADLPDADNAQLVRSRATRRGMWRSAVTYVAIVACAITLIGIPVAIYLYARWAVATPAAAVEDLSVGAAGRRSADLTSTRRWRALAIMAGCSAIASLPGALVGALLLLLTPLSFSLVNVVVIVVTSFAIVCAAVAATLHLFDLRHRVSADAADPQEVSP